MWHRPSQRPQTPQRWPSRTARPRGPPDGRRAEETATPPSRRFSRALPPHKAQTGGSVRLATPTPKSRGTGRSHRDVARAWSGRLGGSPRPGLPDSPVGRRTAPDSQFVSPDRRGVRCRQGTSPHRPRHAAASHRRRPCTGSERSRRGRLHIREDSTPQDSQNQGRRRGRRTSRTGPCRRSVAVQRRRTGQGSTSGMAKSGR